LELTIELNQECSLECKHCSSIAKNKAISLDYIKTILSGFKIDEVKIERIILSGGEPILHSEFKSIVDYLAKDYLVSLYTSGVISLSESIIVKLHQIYVSIYGWEAFHNSITQKTDSFRQSLYFLVSTGIHMKMNRKTKQDVLINSPVFGKKTVELISVAKTGDFAIHLTRLLLHGKASQLKLLSREKQLQIAMKIQAEYPNTIISQSLLHQECNWAKKLTLLSNGQVIHCVSGKWHANPNQEYVCDKIT
jgi:molybdenum cofactor biosynthesis enzyme MoaA